MRIKTRCPNCGKKLGGPLALRGQTVRCSQCQTSFTVPEDLEPVPAPASGPAPAAAASEPEDELEIVGLDAPAPEAARTAPLAASAAPFRPAERRPVNWGAQILNLIFLAAVVAAGYFVWRYYLQDGNAKLTGPAGREAGKTPRRNVPAKKTSSQKTAPLGVPSRTLLIVANGRFPRLEVFANGRRVGTVNRGETRKIILPLPRRVGKRKKGLQISFEAKNLPRGVALGKALAAALDQGLPFSGTVTEGMRITIPGPPPGVLPKDREVLHGVAPKDVSYDPGSRTGKIRRIVYKDHVIQAPGTKSFLRLAWKKKSGHTEFRWLEQDCRIEKKSSGKVIYEPAAKPFAVKAVKLVRKAGGLDEAPSPHTR